MLKFAVLERITNYLILTTMLQFDKDVQDLCYDLKRLMQDEGKLKELDF